METSPIITDTDCRLPEEYWLASINPFFIGDHSNPAMVNIIAYLITCSKSSFFVLIF